jgi:hypothetical protein
MKTLVSSNGLTPPLQETGIISQGIRPFFAFRLWDLVDLWDLWDLQGQGVSLDE